MLKRKYRLSAKIRFLKGQSFNTPFFILRASRNELDYNRYGFVVSKKIDKRAVIRNKVKRTFRLCIENILDEIKSGYDMLFIVKRNIVSEPPNDSCSFLKDFFRGKGFLK